MLKNVINAVAATAAALSVSSVALGAEDAGAFVGEWHWNKAESSVIPGEPLPREVVLRIASATPARVQWTLTRTDADGSQHTESFGGAAAASRDPSPARPIPPAPLRSTRPR